MRYNENMQLPTHFITGVLIDQLLQRSIVPSKARPALLAAGCYLSHGLLDKLARATYHPPDPLDDPFWIAYHKQVLPLFTWFTALWFGPKHWFAMLWAALPDLDWVVRGLSARLGWRIPGWNRPILNESLHTALDHVPIVNRLNQLPDLRYDRRGALVEAGLVTFLLALVILTRPSHHQ